tara:strand:+ start:833 stop:1093 length:261 start_codon:yes stop_codon:yes gene_type:complete
MLSDISNIIIEDEFIIIVTTDGDKHTISIDNDNSVHKGYVDNIISMAISLVDDTNPDMDMDREFSNGYNDRESDGWDYIDGDDDDY